MIKRTNKTWKPFKLGDQVWLDARNLKLSYRSKKMQPKKLGPFKITELIGPRAYRLELPKGWKIHNVFHISLLAPFNSTETHGPSYPKPPPDIIGGEEEYEIEGIINHKVKRNGAIEYLVKWLGYDETQWFKEDELKHAQETLKTYKKDNGL